jgi:Asp/Glu/hydantoin racemase
VRILFLGHQPEDPADVERGPRLRRLLNAYASPGTEIELAYPDDFPGGRVVARIGNAGAFNGLNHAVATGPIIAKIVWAEEQGFDAVVQSNNFDPGVESARLAVRIPVIGMFRAALHVATIFSDRVGILVPLKPHIPYTRRLIRTYGMDGFVADVDALDEYGSNANMTSRRSEIAGKAIERIKGMIGRQGVEWIIPLGGALIPQVISARELEEAVGVPVTDNYQLGIRAAELAVSCGITHSLQTYPVVATSSAEYGLTAYAER